MSYAYAGNKYIDENGKTYKVNGLIIKDGSLVFGTNDKGELIYKDRSTDNIILTINSDIIYLN